MLTLKSLVFEYGSIDHLVHRSSQSSIDAVSGQTALWHTSYTACVFNTMPYTISLCPILTNTTNAGFIKKLFSEVLALLALKTHHIYFICSQVICFMSPEQLCTYVYAILLLLTMKNQKLLAKFK